MIEKKPVCGGCRYAELGKVTLNYMVQRISLHFKESPVYCIDGVNKDACVIYVSVDNDKLDNKSRVRHTVFELVDADNIRRCITFRKFYYGSTHIV